MCILHYSATELLPYQGIDYISPAKLLMDRQLCTDVLKYQSYLFQTGHIYKALKGRIENIRYNRKNNISHHRVRPLTLLPNDTDV